MSQNLLDSFDQERLAQLLTDSQQSNTQERVTLCIRIGIDPAELNFLDNTADVTFSRRLIHHLIRIGNEQALCKLCYEVLFPIFSNNQKRMPILNYIAEKLNCRRSLIPLTSHYVPPVIDPTPIIKIVIFSILGIGVIGVIAIIIKLIFFSETQVSDKTPISSASSPTQINTNNDGYNINLDMISAGERNLAKYEGNSSLEKSNFKKAKDLGINYLEKGQYDLGIQQLKIARSFYNNSPETLIYLNNANIGQKSAYTIAVAASISQDDNYGLGVLRGVALAQQEINKNIQNNNSSLKSPIKVVLVDDLNLVNYTLANFLTQPSINISNRNPDIKIVGLIGHQISDLTLNLGNIYNDKKLPVVSPSSTSTELFGKFTYVHPVAPSTYQMAQKLAQEIKLQQIENKKVIVFYDQKEAFSKSFGEEICKLLVKPEIEDCELLDWSRQSIDVQKRQQINVQKPGIVIAFNPNRITDDNRLKANQIIDLAVASGKKLFAGPTLYDFSLVDTIRKKEVTLVRVSPWDRKFSISDLRPSIVQSIVNNNKTFLDLNTTTWKADVNWFTLMGYNATMALFEAIKKSGSLPPSDDAAVNEIRKKINDQLSGDFSATGALGEIHFKNGFVNDGNLICLSTISKNSQDTAECESSQSLPIKP
ncbi:MAG: ABC transporter substrate-binding protein [Nostoc sp. CmiVER01]|uniref:ABC transporter substrate-binding protein n=1 Tax=Nostoc sp. CmiVER01 TaxID=3075384 RepID=UPI002AD3C4F1|nr:ABC transporter substrate-binding protein [Nostoc sp. CmiVER01]MDZ8123456.1 ABC transporter substrate-binding protein [Nostoc sp. CmiVER01]